MHGEQPVAAVLRWYASEARELPWRREPRTPYRVLVAEAMLQQTRADAVAPRYEAFLQRFPDFAALAAAPRDEVLRSWEGLGYYARARNLHQLAQVLTERRAPLPAAREELLRLPGIGPYVASAVRSFAFAIPDPPLDANLLRIALRVTGTPGTPQESASVRAARTAMEAWFALAPAPALGDALMDLGAGVCTARRPACAECPLAQWCAAFASGEPQAFGVRVPKRPPGVRRILAAQLVSPHGQAWRPRPDRGLLGGLWEPPHVFGESAAPTLEALLQELRGWGVDAAEPAGESWPLRHVFSHQVWQGEVVRLVARSAPRELAPPARWLGARDLADVAVPRAFHAVLAEGR